MTHPGKGKRVRKQRKKSEPYKQPSIAQLEAILNQEEEKAIRILPNGEIVAADKRVEGIEDKKPLTMRDNLGGEYAYA